MSSPWVVLKYGGTSVADAGCWDRIADRVTHLLPSHRAWVVVSAVAGVTNLLEAVIGEALAGRGDAELEELRAVHARLADELGLLPPEREPLERLLEELVSRIGGIRATGEAPPRLTARVLATGELASTHLGAAALVRRGLDVRWVDARRLLCTPERGRRSDHLHYLEADVVARPEPERADEAASGSGVVLTQGFIAGTPDEETALLGRGGSDTSAALFAVLVRAERLEIWSDVHGLFTADPRLVPVARLIRRIGYREARELAAMGARVLHPRCLRPVRDAGIPVTLHALADPEREGTRIEATDEQHPAVTAVTCRRGATLVTLSTLAMWEQAGFLARAFAPFEEHEVSVDLVATSQSAISVTLDKIPGGVDGAGFASLLDRLGALGRVEVIHPCAVVSIVGRRIRAALPDLGPALEVFRERRVHLVSSSSEDLNLSFVVDEEHATSLVGRLHERLFPTQGGDPRLGDTWERLERPAVATASAGEPWWRARRTELAALVADGQARYVYHLPTVRSRARALRRALRSIDRFFYSMKANAHPAVLSAVADEGFGIECVSAPEVIEARRILGPAVPILFTPNFCPLDEYRVALDHGAEVTVDGPEPLELAPALFRGVAIAVRVDPGRGYGHHSKVWTAGARAKFGQPLEAMPLVAAAAARVGARIVGLHAHVGSGIFDPTTWAATAEVLAGLLPNLEAVQWLDLGGGLGVPERPGRSALDLDALERALAACRTRIGPVKLRLEPGRYLVSDAGVLVSPVTQVRRKGDQAFIGLATGMNSFLRPALYGAWHGIHNLSRLDHAPDGYWNVVGPICETSDVLGSDRLLPATAPGDVILLEHAGAYGRVMASRYNLREPAAEVALEH